MRFLTIIRGLCLILLGVTVYSILMHIVGWRIPGRLRRFQKRRDMNCYKHKTLIVLGYYILLAFLIMLGFVLIKYMIRGEI